MPKFLIELDHSPDMLACAQYVRVFLESGSHFLINADWGCMDEVHKAWIVLDADSKDEAMMVVPPAFRAHAQVIGLNKFSLPEINQILGQHRAGA